MAVLGLPCYTWAFFSCGKLRSLLLQCMDLLSQWLLLLPSTGSRADSAAMVHGLNGSMACGIFLDQGLNLCPLNWQVDSGASEKSELIFIYGVRW